MQKTKLSQSTKVQVPLKVIKSQGNKGPQKTGTVGQGNFPTGKTKTIKGKKY